MLPSLRLFSSIHVIAFYISALVASTSIHAATSPKCHSDSLNNLDLESTIPGALITDITSRKLENYKVAARPPYFEESLVTSICEYKVTYLYPLTNTSSTQVTIWLPDGNNWNDRYMGVGGGGWQTTMGEGQLVTPANEGYAVATTDGGLSGAAFETDYTLISPGNPNKHMIDRLGYRSIHEMTILTKEVVRLFYGKSAKTNIFRGCSTGGRQAMMEASRYPYDYDGIVAGAPAFRWNEFVLGNLAGQAVMSEMKYLPSPCEVEAIVKQAIKACDRLDGLEDGVVARPDLCKFHASSAIGKGYIDECSGTPNMESRITAVGAKIVQQYIEGIYASNGEKVSVGFSWGTPLTMPISTGHTIINETTGKRDFSRLAVADQWIHHFLLGGLETIDYNYLTVDMLQSFVKRSKLEYTYAMEPQPDLSIFAKRGGKIMTYHGIEDNIVPVGNTLQKYASVQETMYPRYSTLSAIKKMQEFWRVFLLPATNHCAPYAGNKGSRANDAYKQITRWVEEGIAPDYFYGYQASPEYSKACLWPSKPFWSNGQLECQSGISSIDAIPSTSELLARFIERLPSWLYLEQNKFDL